MNLYKPNAKNSGHCVGFSFDSKKGKLYVELVKQVSWDAAAHKGTFKDGAKFNVTFNATEIATFLNCIERGEGAKLFHSSEKGNTSIELAAYPKPTEQMPKPTNNGFTLSVNPRANEGQEKPQQFGFWFNKPESILLREYLQFVLGHFFAADYSAEKIRRKEYADKKAGAGGDPLA